MGAFQHLPVDEAASLELIRELLEVHVAARCPSGSPWGRARTKKSRTADGK
jgi:hypothetical protein